MDEVDELKSQIAWMEEDLEVLKERLKRIIRGVKI